LPVIGVTRLQVAGHLAKACDSYQLRLFVPMLLFGLRATEPCLLFREFLDSGWLRVPCLPELDYLTKGRRDKRFPQGLVGPITWVLDNVRYQRCQRVQVLAAQLGIRLLFLPSYAPNRNRIERLWKFVRGAALNGPDHADFTTFRAAIDKCLAEIETKHRNKLQTRLTHEFQTFESVSILAA
jgi:DDE superfamily endonuclease